MASILTTPEKPANVDYESDIETTLQYSRWFLQSLGLWPMIARNSSTAEKYISKCLIVVCLLALTFTLVPAALHTILREKNPLVKVMRLAPIAACLASISKFVFIVVRCERIKLCIEHMESDWMRVASPSEREIMLRNARIGRGLTMIACGFLYTGGILYNALMPLLKGSKTNELNETVRPIAHPGFELFVDPQRSPNYEIIFVGICVACFIRYNVTIAACNLAAVFVTHACGQIQIVMARLDGLFDEIDEAKGSGEKLQERISSVVHCHVRGLRLSTRIDDTLREICLIEVVAATLIICLLEYYCMTEWNNSETMAIITYFFFLISHIFNVFIFCYIGEILKEQCFQVGISTYLIDWYKLPGKTGLALVMILAMANFPRRITAGRMIDLSVASFGMIMQTSVMYLNMLRAVTA